MVGTEIRRVVVSALDDIAIETVPQPEPGPGEVRVRTVLVGICGSDLHAACGHHPFIDLPYRPGHEAVGVVETLGAGVDESWLGARVAVEPNLACGACAQCRDGRYNICRELRVFGCQTPGALADSFVIGADRLVRLDDALDDRHAILIEPLATPVHTVRRAEQVVGDLTDRPVVVIGAGPIGLFALLAARHAARASWWPICWSPSGHAPNGLAPSALSIPAAPDAVATALDLLGGPAAVVIDCVARESSVAQAVDLVDKGGAVMIVGVAEGATPVPLGLIQDREIALIGNLMYVRDDFAAAIDMLASGAVPVDEIISAEYEFDHTDEAFAASADGENVKVLVSMGNPS